MYNHERLTSNILNILNNVLKYEIEGFSNVSFTYIDLSPDKSSCKVFFDTYMRANAVKIEENLNKKSGLFRTLLSKKMDIYKVPKLAFHYDKTLENAEKIEKLLKT
jgi:ribosome-binding factor A